MATETPLETALHARVGRQAIALEEKDSMIGALLEMLADVVSGKTERSRVMVNLTNRSVVRVEIGETPSLPATINGEPRCVVAPPEPDPLLKIQAALRAEPDVTKTPGNFGG